MFTGRAIDCVRGIVWAVALGILTLTFARVVEQTASGFAFDALVGSKSWRVNKSNSYEQPGLVFFGVLAATEPIVPTSFLLFDFKQNLRHWPVLAGDISRSPPFFAAL
jgi:hypothetical protein